MELRFGITIIGSIFRYDYRILSVCKISMYGLTYVIPDRMLLYLFINFILLQSEVKNNPQMKVVYKFNAWSESSGFSTPMINSGLLSPASKQPWHIARCEFMLSWNFAAESYKFVK